MQFILLFQSIFTHLLTENNSITDVNKAIARVWCSENINELTVITDKAICKRFSSW